MEGNLGNGETTLLDTLTRGIEALGHGFAVWSDSNQLVTCNSAFSRRFNIENSQDLKGLTYDAFLAVVVDKGDIIIRQSKQDWITTEKAAMQGNLTRELVFADSSIYRLECFPDEKGGFVSFLQDVTHTVRNEQTLKTERDKSADTEQVKSRFLRAANHDLRQPLAALKILIYNCIETQSEEIRQQALHNMDVSVSIMEDLLGALLNIGQLDAGRVEARPSTFQLWTILERLKIQFGHQAEEKGLELRVRPSRLALVSDRALLERILSNFVGNALRYTATGGGLIGCRQAGDHIRIEVWDTGSGIESENHENIFKEFFRISDAQMYRKHSLGLGLNIAQRLAEVLHHKIAVKSIPGKGSVFSIEVPTGNIWHSDIGEPEINERIGGEFAGLTVIVLEDDQILRQALVDLLDRWGINVIIFDQYNDIQPQILALDNEPDFIITDYRLQGSIQGTDLVIEINDTLQAPCPAIVVTADTNPTLIDMIRQQGFPVLIKPVSPPRLRVTMHNLLYEPELVPELS